MSRGSVGILELVITEGMLFVVVIFLLCVDYGVAHIALTLYVCVHVMWRALALPSLHHAPCMCACNVTVTSSTVTAAAVTFLQYWRALNPSCMQLQVCCALVRLQSCYALVRLQSCYALVRLQSCGCKAVAQSMHGFTMRMSIDPRLSMHPQPIALPLVV